MRDEKGRATDIELVKGAAMPFPCSLFIFETSQFPEGALHINQEGGILVTCDSIKNWLSADKYFNAESIKLYEEQGFFGTASISSVWKQTCKVDVSDFERLIQLPFCHLLSAHGEPLLNDAHEKVEKTIKQEFGT